jgi:hypothetical protein
MMGLSISRGGDLTPKQPTVEENIAAANKMLDEYGKKLDGQYIYDNGMWDFLLWKYKELGKPESVKEKLINLAAGQMINIIFGGGDLVDKDAILELVANAMSDIMDQTELDDIAFDKAADFVKEQIPGDYIEPVVGRVMVGIGEELMKQKK